jgi:hypothetical protein
LLRSLRLSRTKTMPNTNVRVARVVLTLVSVAVLNGCLSGDGMDGGSINAVVEEGLTRDFGTSLLPDGQFAIQSDLEASVEGPDIKGRRFAPAALEVMRRFESAGLLTLTESSASEKQKLMSFGARSFHATPTPRLQELLDTTIQLNDGYVRYISGTAQVETIVQDSRFTPPAAAPSQEYRLVMGTFTWNPGEITRLVSPEKTRKTFRFRAFLHFDPSDKKWSYQRADYAEGTTGGWQTQNIQ